jgi:hypothetical protein
MVLRSNGTENGASYRDLEKKIDELLALAQRHDYQGIQSKLGELVPEYKPQSLSEDMKFKCERIVDLEDETDETDEADETNEADEADKVDEADDAGKVKVSSKWCHLNQ